MYLDTFILELINMNRREYYILAELDEREEERRGVDSHARVSSSTCF
jgi:hypothetical protein